jgi:hypothetical protein
VACCAARTRAPRQTQQNHQPTLKQQTPLKRTTILQFRLVSNFRSCVGNLLRRQPGFVAAQRGVSLAALLFGWLLATAVGALSCSYID